MTEQDEETSCYIVLVKNFTDKTKQLYLKLSQVKADVNGPSKAYPMNGNFESVLVPNHILT